ncbi:MAG: dephospho-CoA kinase [Omnitrophica WOR_2 bacterium]
MLKIGLTGSIGSGKSTIAKVFALLGVPVYLSDYEAKKILDQEDIIIKISERFGNEMLSSEGKIDRSILASIVFNNPSKLQWLNSLIHPLVRKHFFSWVDSNKKHPYIIQESAIMLETGFNTFFDKVIVVTCPIEERIKRVLYRDKMTREQIIERMENQWPEELKVKKADIVLENSDMSMVLPQIIELNRELIIQSKEGD